MRRPRSDPVSAASDPQKRALSMLKFHRAKRSVSVSAGLETQASAAALTALLRPDCAGSSMCSKGQKDQIKIAFLVLSARRWTFESLRFVNNGGKCTRTLLKKIQYVFFFSPSPVMTNSIYFWSRPEHSSDCVWNQFQDIRQITRPNLRKLQPDRYL